MSKSKLTIIVPSIILLMVISGIFFINNSQKNQLDLSKEETKVGIILNGSAHDYSWGQSHMEGLQKTAQKLKLKIVYVQNVPEDERCIRHLQELVTLNCKVIIADSFSYGPYIKEMSQKYPDIYFFHATGLDYSKNLTSYFGRVYQIRYLSGVVAGLQTSTNKIGYVAAMPISEVIRGINAFTLGVKSVNPEATVYVVWSNSWENDTATEIATIKLLSEEPDIDILAMHTDSQKVLEIAEKRKIWSIGYNLDNSNFYPETFLTAPVWDWEKFYTPQILLCKQGKFIGKHYWFDLDSGISYLAPLTKNVKPGISERVTEARERLESGLWDVFYGPVYDNRGQLKIPEEENLSDSVMLDYFDWYVDGVVVYE